MSDVLRDSARLGEFAAVFDAPVKDEGLPTHLHFHGARILQGGGDPRDGRDEPGCVRGRQRLDRGRLQLFRPLSGGDGNRLHAVWARPAYRLGPHCCSGVGQTDTGVPSIVEAFCIGLRMPRGAALGTARQVKPS